MIKILSWNIQQGGGSRLSKITKALKEINAHIVVLSEYRNNNSGIQLRNIGLSMGYRYQMVSNAPNNDNSVIIMSMLPCNFKLFPKSDAQYGHNVIKAEYDAFDVYGMYLPHKKKHQLFDLLLQEASVATKPVIYCGDMNTGINGIDQKGTSFWYSDELIELNRHGLQDAFRYKYGQIEEYSWYSHQKNGYRYDHTYVHEDLLPIISDCAYLHDYRERGLSDHSPMLLSMG